MKIYGKVLLVLYSVVNGLASFAQDSLTVAGLLKQGQELSGQKKFTEAIDKYKSALTTEPANPRANYEMAFTLYSAGKGNEGIPYLEEAVRFSKSPQFTAGAYSLLGSIYGGADQLQKAIAAYRKGILADSTNHRVYYNLGIVQYRGKQYSDAEKSFIDAIKRDSAYAASVRMYALSAFHQNKRAGALLGFCRFLMLEPNSAQSGEAFGNLQNILNGGSLKPEPGYKSSATTKAAADHQNKALAKALSGFAARRYATPGNLLTAKLKAVFDTTGSMPKGTYYFSGYFYILAQTDHMEAFARLISQNAYPDSKKWLKDNAGKVAAFEVWMKGTKTGF